MNGKSLVYESLKWNIFVFFCCRFARCIVYQLNAEMSAVSLTRHFFYRMVSLRELHFYGGLCGYNEKTAFSLLRGFSLMLGRLL